MTRETGELVDWKDDRGFGFIRRPDGVEIFVHIRSIRRASERPKIGDRMSYSIGVGKGGRSVATDVDIVASTPAAPAPGAQAAAAPKARPLGRPKTPDMLLSGRVWAAASLLALLAANIYLDRLPVWVAGLYLIASITSFCTYWIDKRAANAKISRTPESTLHTIDLVFGVIGGLLAQHILRHKTFKKGYIFETGVIAAVHILLLGLVLLQVFGPHPLDDLLHGARSGPATTTLLSPGSFPV
jgi:uncharacterized membrane protein YsdA (DUF1294 family)/cold shock CspA family protein